MQLPCRLGDILNPDDPELFYRVCTQNNRNDSFAESHNNGSYRTDENAQQYGARKPQITV